MNLYRFPLYPRSYKYRRGWVTFRDQSWSMILHRVSDSTRFGVDERWMEKGEGSESRSLVSRSEPRGMNNPWTSWEEANISFTSFIGHFAWNAQMFIHTLYTRVNELSAYKIIHEAIKQFCTFSFYLISQWNPFACVIIAPSGGKLRIKNYPIFIFIFLFFSSLSQFRGRKILSLFFAPLEKQVSTTEYRNLIEIYGREQETDRAMGKNVIA